MLVPLVVSKELKQTYRIALHILDKENDYRSCSAMWNSSKSFDFVLATLIVLSGIIARVSGKVLGSGDSREIND